MSEELTRKLELAERAYRLSPTSPLTWRIWHDVQELALHECNEAVFDRADHIIALMSPIFQPRKPPAESRQERSDRC